MKQGGSEYRYLQKKEKNQEIQFKKRKKKNLSHHRRNFLPSGRCDIKAIEVVEHLDVRSSTKQINRASLPFCHGGILARWNATHCSHLESKQVSKHEKKRIEKKKISIPYIQLSKIKNNQTLKKLKYLGSSVCANKYLRPSIGTCVKHKCCIVHDSTITAKDVNFGANKSGSGAGQSRSDTCDIPLPPRHGGGIQHVQITETTVQGRKERLN
jgi:hypothetical protein